MLYSDPFMGMSDPVLSNIVKETGKIPYAGFAKDLEEAGKNAGEFAYIFRSLSKLCYALDIKATLGLEIRAAYKAGDKAALLNLAEACAEASKRVGEFHEAFFVFWHKENKPQGWEVQDARLGGLMQRLKTCERRLKAFVNGETDKIEELEEELIPQEGNKLRHNYYTTNVSFSAM